MRTIELAGDAAVSVGLVVELGAVQAAIARLKPKLAIVIRKKRRVVEKRVLEGAVNCWKRDTREKSFALREPNHRHIGILRVN
jgi:hypothetical protein